MRKYASLLILAALAVQAAGEDAKKSWADSLKVKGDLRYRHEMIDEEGKDTRNRQRLRARLNAEATISEELDAAIGLASGSEDPVSTNQDLGEAFSTKRIGLDLAYFDWHPEALGGLNLIGGKMKKPFVCVSDLVWDGDLNPEGAALQYKWDADALELLANAGGFWVVERSADDDTMLYAGQLAAKCKPAEGQQYLAGAGGYHFTEMEGRELLVDPAKSFGNSTRDVAADGATNKVYATDFSEIELFAEAKFAVGLPVRVYGQYVVNNEADDLDTGYLAGVSLWNLGEPGTFQFDYSYRDLEKDAVVGAFTDSDSFGGGTDGRGHKFAASYQIAKNWQAGVSYLLNEKSVQKGAKDYDRLQVDLAAKF